MAEKSTECFLRGVIPSNSLNDLISTLKVCYYIFLISLFSIFSFFLVFFQSYSCPHLNNNLILTKDSEYFSTQSRMIIYQRDEYSINIQSFSIDTFSDQIILEQLQSNIQPVRY